MCVAVLSHVCCSIRAMYGVDVKANAIHASSSAKRVMEEVKVAFPDIEFNEDGTPRSMQRTRLLLYT